MKTMKKMMAMLLATSMVMSLLSVQVLAAEEVEGETPTSVTELVDNGDGTTTQVVTTTTTETDESGNVTVVVTIDKDINEEIDAQINSEEDDNVTDDGVEVTLDATRTEEYESDGTDENGVPVKGELEHYVDEGTETKEWTEEDCGDTSNQPPVEVELKPGETITGTAETTETIGDVPDGEDDSEYDYTVTTTTDRTVTASTSKLEVTVNDADGGLVGEQEIKLEGLAPVYDEIDGEKQDKVGMFDNQFNAGLSSEYANLENWVGENSMPENADLRYLGTGEHTDYYTTIVYVVYERDADGNTVYNENGEPVIKELWRRPVDRFGRDESKNQQLLLDGQITTELPEDIYGLPEYDNANGNRPSIHLMMDEYGNTVYGYCIDNGRDPVDGKWYTISNLEDSNYYASEDAENHVRNIVLNGYWGTSNIQQEDGTYKEGSVESIKEKLLNAAKEGKLDAEVKIYEYDDKGNHIYDENGEPKYVLASVEDVIAGLTAGEAMIATQSAIWSYSNGSIAAQNGQDGLLVIDPDFFGNHMAKSKYELEDVLDGYGGARIDLMYNWLMNLENEEESTVIINEKNFVEDLSITVGDKVADHANNQDDNVDNDVYNTDLNFTLAFVPGEKDDLLVQITYTDLNGNPVNIVKRLAGENAEGQTYEDIKPEADGSYVLRGLKLSENEDFEFDLRLEGTQYLENGVYIYEAVGGRTVSQNFVGVAEGERNVDISIGVTVKFDVDEDDHIRATRTWREEGPDRDPGDDNDDVTPPDDDGDDDITPPGDDDEEDVTPPDDGETPPTEESVEIPDEDVPMTDIPKVDVEQDEIVELPEEEIPLADVPKTGDASAMWMLLSTLSGSGLLGLALTGKKRKED